MDHINDLHHLSRRGFGSHRGRQFIKVKFLIVELVEIDSVFGVLNVHQFTLCVYVPVVHVLEYVQLRTMVDENATY